MPPSARMPPDRDPAQQASLIIEFIELETFIAVAQTGSFSLAAQRLHVTQPSVTGRVQRLESALGTRLLVRTTRKVEITPDGRKLLLEAIAAIKGLRSVVEGFRQRARLARHRVVIAATPMLAALTLPPVIHAYSERYTDVQIELRDLQYPDALAALDAGTADVAVLALEEEDAGYRFQSLWTDDMVLVVPVKHPLARRGSVGLAELARLPLTIVSQYQPMVTRIAEQMKTHGLSLARARSVANLNTLLGMLDAGLGMTLLPRAMGRRNAAYRIVEIEGVVLQRRYGIATPHKARLSTAAQSFCKFLQRAMVARD